MMPGPTELIIILVIVMVLFGAKKIPDLAKGLGTGIKEFKKATLEDDKDEENTNESPLDIIAKDLGMTPEQAGDVLRKHKA